MTRMTNNPTRRGFLGGLTATALAAAVPMPAFALNNAEAKALVDKLVVEINRVIASGKSLNAMIREFERIFGRYGDVPLIARSALGPDARRMTNSQMSAYVAAFRGYMARKYGKRFQEFIGGKIEVQRTRKVKSWYEVQTVAKLRGEAPFQLNFFISDKSGKDLFFDMIVEGVSVRLSEKEEIGAMLDRNRGDIDKLIADLKRAG